MFDSVRPLQALVTLVTNLSGMQRVYTGVPESIANQVAAYVTLGAQEAAVPGRGFGARRVRSMNYRVTFAYRVQGAEGDAEIALARLVDGLEQALQADETLGGTVKSLELDAGLADDPAYLAIAGQEYREYPVTVRVIQEEAP